MGVRLRLRLSRLFSCEKGESFVRNSHPGSFGERSSEVQSDAWTSGHPLYSHAPSAQAQGVP